MYVDCPNEEDENDDEDHVGTGTSGLDVLTDVGVDLEVGIGLGGGNGDGDRDIEVGDEVGGEQGVDVEVSMDKDSKSDSEWDPYDNRSSSNASLSGVEESSDDEQEESIPIIGLGLNFGVDQIMDAGFDGDYNNLVEQEEDENGNQVYPEFKDSYLKNPQLIEGMKFPNVTVFRKLLREYHIKEGYTFKFIKNESSRVTVKCAENCGFRLHASPIIQNPGSRAIMKVERPLVADEPLFQRMFGLTQVFVDYYPNVEHRYCIRHLYANFNEIYKGKEWKDLMWGVASAFITQEFDHKINETKEIDEESYDWLMREDPITWARCMIKYKVQVQ
ncbi:hypothetical protein Vadar_008459 [Vaccinium darrowii]|uniref:Uncharacterized protein n=1 Tax=Vaccinium darrowii TaxID=229202 RepID=A0ACB7XZ10_9ERIC|nr:hypothetical protein Vadar_008459 [Vaccinium darrowii]